MGLGKTVTTVAPFAGAWIEIARWQVSTSAAAQVAPFAGAWIEMRTSRFIPVRTAVAPFAGAWIEMQVYVFPLSMTFVAPFAGAWIEIRSARRTAVPWKASLPSRERGLKLS